MFKAQAEQPIVDLYANVDLRSGTRSIQLDDLLQLESQEVPGSPKLRVPIASTEKPTPIIEFRMRITVNGLPFEIPKPSVATGSYQDGTLATVRAPGIDERFARHQRWFERQLEDEVREIARRRLGDRGWIILGTEVSFGSLILGVALGIPAGLWFAYQAVAGYPDFKVGLPMVFDDLVYKAPKLVRTMWRKLLDVDEMPELQPATAAESAPVGEDTSMAAELRRILADSLSSPTGLLLLKPGRSYSRMALPPTVNPLG